LSQISNYKLQYFFGDTLARETAVEATGYLEDIIPASLVTNKNLKIKLVNNEQKEVLTQDFASVEKGRLFSVLPNKFEKEILKFELKDKEITDNCFWEYSIGKNLEKGQVKAKNGNCEILIKPTNTTKNSQALLKVTAKDRDYYQLINTQTQIAVGTFDVFANTSLNEQNGLEVKLVATNILDKNGNLVNGETIKWNYNGISATSQISGGQASILVANVGQLEDGFAKLDLDIKTGKAVAKNNNLKFFVGDKKIAQRSSDIEILNYSDYSTTGEYEMIITKSSCNVYLDKLLLNSILIDGICYTGYKLETGKYLLNFVKNNRSIGNLDLEIGPKIQTSNIIENIITSNTKIEATLFDGANQYKFEEENGSLKIYKDGLDPLKNYKIIYKIISDSKTITKEVTLKGEKIMQK
jgi:hypothetical protein